jgi:hypothetical protein
MDVTRKVWWQPVPVKSGSWQFKEAATIESTSPQELFEKGIFAKQAMLLGESPASINFGPNPFPIFVSDQQITSLC